MPTQNRNTKFKTCLEKRAVRGTFILLVLFSFGLTCNAYAEDSVFHYIKPDWWSEGLWPMGIKYSYGDSYARYDLNKEAAPGYEINPVPADDSINGYVEITDSPRFPWAFTFPETVFGQWGSLLFFGQSFLDYNPPDKFENGRIEGDGRHEKSFYTDDDHDKCESLGAIGDNCEIVWNLDNKATYMAGYSIGFSPFASSSGNHRLLKFSIGLGVAFIDIKIDLSLCTEAGGGNNGYGISGLKEQKIDSTHITGLYPMTTMTIKIYEYMGEDFGFSFLSGETARTTIRTEFKNRDNLDFSDMITDVDIFSISWFF